MQIIKHTGDDYRDIAFVTTIGSILRRYPPGDHHARQEIETMSTYFFRHRDSDRKATQ